MTYTSHGHRIRFSPGDENPPKSRARCGGPGLCKVCSQEESAYHNAHPERLPKEENETASKLIEIDLEQIRLLTDASNVYILKKVLETYFVGQEFLISSGDNRPIKVKIANSKRSN